MDKSLSDYLPRSHDAEQTRIQMDYIPPAHELQPPIPPPYNTAIQQMNLDEFDPKALHRQ